MRRKLSELCKLFLIESLLMIFVMLLMVGCGKEEITGSIAEEKQNASKERQTDGMSTEPFKDDSSSDGTEDKEELSEDTLIDGSEYASIVRITINPQVELYLDAEDRIVSVVYLNKDAEDAFSNIHMTELSLEDAVRQIVSVSFDEGYLTEGKTITVDFVEQDEKVNLPGRMEMVQNVVREELSERQLTVTLEIETSGEVQDSFILEPDEQRPSDETLLSSGQTGSDKASEAAGEPCPDCGGTGICPECGGGTLPCKRCGGSLWESCGVCGGSGRQSCPGCHGSGKDATSGETCRHCGGAGGMSCEVCGGAGGKSCSICNGKGVVSDDCILCHGGKACTVCGGLGIKK